MRESFASGGVPGKVSVWEIFHGACRLFRGRRPGALSAERLHRLDPGRPARGKPAGDERDRLDRERRRGERRSVVYGDAMQQVRQDATRRSGGEQPDDAPGNHERRAPDGSTWRYNPLPSRRGSMLGTFDRGATPSTRDAAPLECGGAFATG